DRRARRDLFEKGAERWRVINARRVELAAVAVADHVEVDVEGHVALLRLKLFDERARADESDLFGVERGEDHRVVGPFAAEVRGQLQQRGDARSVVVSAVVNLPAAYAEVVVVRRDDDEAFGVASAAKVAD